MEWEPERLKYTTRWTKQNVWASGIDAPRASLYNNSISSITVMMIEFIAVVAWRHIVRASLTSSQLMGVTSDHWITADYHNDTINYRTTLTECVRGLRSREATINIRHKVLRLLPHRLAAVTVVIARISTLLKCEWDWACMKTSRILLKQFSAGRKFCRRIVTLWLLLTSLVLCQSPCFNLKLFIVRSACGILEN